MDKKILATAIAGVLAGSMSVVAYADTTVFGNVNVSIDATDVDGGNDDINMSSNTSSVGVKGSEDLGNGLKAIFQIELEVEADEATSGSNTVTDRDMFVGLTGDFGKVRFGSMSTSYKSHGAMIDPIYRTSLQGRSHGLQSALHDGAGDNGEGRMNNHIRYDSPNFNGVQITLDYSLDSEESTTVDDDTYGIGGQYQNGPILVFADYLTTGHGGEDDAWKIGGSFSFDNLAVYAQFEQDGGLISDFTTEPGKAAAENTNEEADVWTIGGSATFGNTLVYLAYGQGDDDDAAGNTEYDAYTIAVDHNLSKRTDVYAGYNQVDCDSNAGSTCSGLPANGGETDFFSVGMRHKF